jgi:predicted  nucleic acid-binding Zn-ribbon protein
MSRASTLFRLQEIDLELDAHRTRLEAITEALSSSAAVRAAQQAALEAEAQFNAARVEVRALEYDNQALSEKMAEVEKRLYSGAVTNAKELQDLHKDMQLLQHRRAALEEQQFEALIKAETAEARLLAAQHAFQQAEAEAARTNSHLVEEQITLQTRGAKLEEEREATQASIPAEDRELYERLRRSKNGRPVARLEDGVCAACGVAPSSARSQSVRQGGALTRCGNCERILYAE